MFSTDVPKWDQPDDFRLRDDGGLFQEEVIGRFRLDLPGLAGRDSARVRLHGQVPFATDPYA
jgi:hypothetical protein